MTEKAYGPWAGGMLLGVVFGLLVFNGDLVVGLIFGVAIGLALGAGAAVVRRNRTAPSAPARHRAGG